MAITKKKEILTRWFELWDSVSILTLHQRKYIPGHTTQRNCSARSIYRRSHFHLRHREQKRGTWRDEKKSVSLVEEFKDIKRRKIYRKASVWSTNELSRWILPIAQSRWWISVLGNAIPKVGPNTIARHPNQSKLYTRSGWDDRSWTPQTRS